MNKICDNSQFSISTLFSREAAAQTAVRCGAIDEYQILETPREPRFDDITKLAATICEASFAAISFVCDDRQWFKSEIGIGIDQTPISKSFCAYAIRQPDLFTVLDAQQHPLFSHNPLVVGDPGIRFYAGMPITAHDGTPIATLCVLDVVARPLGISDIQRQTLQVLAKQVEVQLELRRAIIERDDRSAEQHSTSLALQWMAHHDPLTKLGNRTLFHSQLEGALSTSNSDGSGVALILIDVDHFKQINDSLGHDAGDALLCSFASRLRSIVRPGDTVARLGGDEFGIILTSIKSDTQLEAIVNSLKNRLHEKLNHNGRLIDCRASIGVATYANPNDAADTLIKQSDLALSVAKTARGCAVIFHPDMETDFEYNEMLTSRARAAIEQNRVFPYYQPKVDLQTGALTGFEALLRWKQIEGNLGLPQMIAPAFLDPELAHAIGERMIVGVLDDMRTWVDAGVNFGRVAINACAGDFATNDYAERLLAALTERELSPHLVEVEVTESVFMDRGSHFVLRALTMLSEQGVRIALDDFGTGYASLTHLKKFPVDVLKIDQTFVAGLGKSEDDQAIVRAIISLGNSLAMETVAEGIETQEQLSFVRQCGCTVVQGFLFSAALPALDVPSLVKTMAPNTNVIPFGVTQIRRSHKSTLQ